MLFEGSRYLRVKDQTVPAPDGRPVQVKRVRPLEVPEGSFEYVAKEGDRLDLLRIAADEGQAQLRAVKPCGRCPIPNVDPATAQVDTNVTDTLQGYRRSEVLGGAVAFGMNAIVLEGEERTLRVGQEVSANWKFA